MQTATADQVLKHYRDQGYQVRIDADGRVEYRLDGDWLEGRWVSEYRVDDTGAVHLR